MRTIRAAVSTAILEREARKHLTARDRRHTQRLLPARKRRVQRTHRDDEPIAMQLQLFHARLNNERFEGKLKPIAVRVSRRMRSRLGHYAPAQRGAPAEIAVSKSHVKRHGFEQAVLTLLHEMVHQWQDETGRVLDHGAEFRAKAREVGITARAARAVD